jgi:hypothetical protein
MSHQAQVEQDAERKTSVLSILHVSASKLNEYIGTDCSSMAQLYRLQETLTDHAQAGSTRFRPSKGWFQPHPYYIPRYACARILKELKRFGAEEAMKFLLLEASKCETRDALSCLPAKCRRMLFQENKQLLQCLQDAKVKLQAAFGSALTQDLNKRMLLVSGDHTKNLEDLALWILDIEQASPEYGRVNSADLGILRQRLGSLRACLIHLGSLEFHVQREARRAYGKAAETACRAVWNEYFEEELRLTREMLCVPVLAGRCALKGFTDGYFEDGTIVELKFRVERFQPRRCVPRMAELLQVHAYMCMHEEAKEAVLIEGIHTSHLMLLREHKVPFDADLWARAMQALGRFLDFRDKLESDEWFRFAFFAMDNRAQAKMLKEYVAFHEGKEEQPKKVTEESVCNQRSLKRRRESN